MPQHLKWLQLRIVIPLMIALAVGARFIQVQNPVTASTSALEANSSNLTAEQKRWLDPNFKWDARWQKYFAHYEKVTKRKLTPVEKQRLATAYANFRRDTSKTLGLSEGELSRREDELSLSLQAAPVAKTPPKQ